MNSRKQRQERHTDKSAEASTSTCDLDCHSCTYNINPLLAGLDVADRSLLDTDRVHVHFKRGELIYREGVYPSGLYCLNKGKVMITKSDDFGNTLTINLHQAVCFLGIADILTSRPYQSTCVALSDVTACLIKYDNINLFLEKNSPFPKRLLTTLSNQYHQANNRLLAMTKKNMTARMADALLELIDVFGESKHGYIDVYLKREELAQLSNMSLANAIRQLSILNTSNIISIEGKKIKILNKAALVKDSLMG